MKIPKLTLMTLASGVVTVALSGAALADSSLNTTGPNSQNTITVTQTNDVTVSNHNDIQVTNSNQQSAGSGSAKVEGNTTGGAATSGMATNTNSFLTSITLGNATPVGNCGCDGQGGGSGSTATLASSTGNGPSGQTKLTGGKGGGLLPETGATIPMDVSALRALYHPAGTIPTQTAAIAHAKSLSTVMLAIAAVLSLLGALGSATISTKRTLKV